MQIDHDSTGKNRCSSVAGATNLTPSLSPKSVSKTNSTTTAPNPRSGSLSTTMVASSTQNSSTNDAKSSSSPQSLAPRKDSNASTSGAFSEPSRSYGQEENSSDSLFSHTSPSSHYVVKCNVNPPNSGPIIPSTTFTPRVKVTVQQPSVTTRTSRFDTPVENSSSKGHLKTPATSSALPIMTTSTASSAPEFSLSGPSSVDDSDELALYDQYLSAYGRQSNPSPELRKKTFDDWTGLEQRSLPRSKSEINTLPIDQSDLQINASQLKKVCHSGCHLSVM